MNPFLFPERFFHQPIIHDGASSVAKGHLCVYSFVNRIPKVAPLCQDPIHHPNPKTSAQLSTIHITTSFLLFVSLSSLPRLSGLMIVGANTTAIFKLVMRFTFSWSTTRFRCRIRYSSTS